MRPDTAAQGETALTKRIFITFCAAAACCELLGAWVENGEYPADMEALETMVKDICYYNAKRYFNL